MTVRWESRCYKPQRLALKCFKLMGKFKISTDDPESQALIEMIQGLKRFRVMSTKEADSRYMRWKTGCKLNCKTSALESDFEHDRKRGQCTALAPCTAEGGEHRRSFGDVCQRLTGLS